MSRWLVMSMICVGHGLAHAETTQDAAAASPGEIRSSGDAPPSGEAKKGNFSLGAGYSPDDGAIFQAEVGQPNLLGSGQGLSLSAELSKIHQRAALTYDVPLRNGLSLRSELFTDLRDTGGFRRESIGGSFELSRALARSTRVFVRYRAERVEMSALPPSDGVVARRIGMTLPAPGLISTLGSGLRFDTRDGTGLHGSRLELLSEISTPGSQASFARLRATAETARTFGRLTLRLHGHASVVRSGEAGGVALSERLFDAGNADVRGYALGTLGPATGANYEAVGRAEVELAVWRKAGLSVATFFDAGVRGNLDDAFGPAGETTRRSVGASLIWRGPLGPVRLDYAVPLDGKRERQWLFSFGIGF